MFYKSMPHAHVLAHSHVPRQQRFVLEFLLDLGCSFFTAKIIESLGSRWFCQGESRIHCEMGQNRMLHAEHWRRESGGRERWTVFSSGNVTMIDVLGCVPWKGGCLWRLREKQECTAKDCKTD